MKQTFTFYPSVIASTASTANAEIFDLSIEAFEQGEYLKSLHLLLDSINKDLRTSYSNPQGNEFHIPHGPLFIRLKEDEEQLYITAPFLILPEKNQIAMLRQVSSLNFNDLDLAHLVLKGNQFYFEYHCPLSFSHPRKIHYVLKEICTIGNKYDYEFQDLFAVQRINRPFFTPYTPEEVEYVYEAIQQSCKECLQGLRYFESSRKFGDMWDILSATFLKIMYVAHPQGSLRDTLEKAIRDMNRNIPLAAIVTNGRQTLEEIQALSPEELAKSLYFTATFISDKQRSNMQKIREYYEKCYKQVSACLEAGDYRTVCLRITHKFYETYYQNHMQEDLNCILVKALTQASACSWSKAAPILYQTLEAIMQGPQKNTKFQNPIAA